MKKYESFTEDQLREIFSSSNHFSEILNKLGYAISYKNNKIVKEISERYNISIDHLKRKSLPFEDLTGKTFGRWTVLEKDTTSSTIKWICKCSCEQKTIRSVKANDLKSGKSTSCGCKRKEKLSLYGTSTGIDLLNQRFGKLVVIQKDENKHSNRKNYWICQCDCGNITPPIEGSSLRRENGTRSCGCLNSEGELLIGKFLKENNINFKKQFSFMDLVGEVDPLKFDFAILDNNKVIFLIEYQGIQHYCPVDFFGGEETYKKQIKFDTLKKEYCLRNNIPLLEISYKDKNKINEILEEWCTYYGYD